MLSARIAAFAAVTVIGFSAATPAAACDDRGCPKLATPPQAETTDAVMATKRKAVRKTAVRESRRAKARRIAAERRSFKLASVKEVPARGHTVVARRFQGFIDPKPMADNPFETLRKPRPDQTQLSGEADPLAADMWPVVAEDSRNIRFALAERLSEATTDVIPIAAPVDDVPAVATPAPDAAPPAAPVLAMPLPQQETVQVRASDPERLSLGRLLLMLFGAVTTASVLGFVVRA